MCIISIKKEAYMRHLRKRPDPHILNRHMRVYDMI